MKKLVFKHRDHNLFLNKKRFHCSTKISLNEITELQCTWHCACAENPHRHTSMKTCAGCGQHRPTTASFVVEDVKAAIHFGSVEEASVHIEELIEETPFGEVAKEFVLMWIELHE